MEITIIAVGKLKEKYLKSGIAEYLKRMKSYATVKIVEVNDEPAGQTLSAAEVEQVKEAEGQRIIEKIPERARVIALDLRGKQLTSEAFAEEINETMTYGTSQIAFIIGGSHGLSQEVLSKTDLKISFGKMTYPHQLMRLILVEQIYRAFKIIRNEPYHK
ncbi:MAG TPA: 23S rRNA (pseudouridine(1915)-N(3))-methyltransferase RlmH [Atopostipes sp.]|nr:23S rRNA (pseudouridine(1915)-N(3))-methyltransferase RlmH [Atopostipes sp.]